MRRNVILLLMAIGAFVTLSIVLKTALALLPIIAVVFIGYSLFRRK